jgi:hypothetical protein
MLQVRGFMNQQSTNNFSSSWDDDTPNTLITAHRPDWTWEELHEHEASVMTPMLRSADQAVALIADMRSASYFDPIDTPSHIRQTGEMHRALPVEMVVFVLRDPAIATLMTALYERHGAHDVVYRSARTLSQARLLIAEHRGGGRYSNVTRLSGQFTNLDRDRLAGD